MGRIVMRPRHKMVVKLQTTCEDCVNKRFNHGVYGENLFEISLTPVRKASAVKVRPPAMIKSRP